MDYKEFIKKVEKFKGDTLNCVSFEEVDATLRELIMVRGSKMTLQILIEELSELIQPICKDLRNDTSNTEEKRIKNRNSILEELTDVENFIHAAKIIYNFTDEELLAAKTVKILRMQERIEELRNE